ncbi:MAG: nitroreductase family protein [Dissulfurimicrobium sp.]|uniref:nitroreductase family protein n=1 Tax=Dissulfurimicrobium sp. TaxID=2022436 RepID=UPI00404B857E
MHRYRDKDLNPELIDKLLEISCHAPTGVNARSVLFTAVRERAVMNRLRYHIAQVQKAETLPKDLRSKYLDLVVNAWRQEGKDILFHGTPHLIITSAPSNAHCPVQDTLILPADRPYPRGRDGLGRHIHDGFDHLPGCAR